MDPNNVKVKTGITPEQSQHVELTAEELERRKQESLFILEGPEELLRKQKELENARSKEVIELQNGRTVTYESFLTKDRQPYHPKFPNDVPFYSEIFRVADLMSEWNPNDFYKPPIIAVLTNELIYSRFGKTMVSELRNRAVAQGLRLGKFFQYFDVEGQKKVIEFRDDAIKMLGEFKSGELYEFRLAYATQYHTSFQLKMNI